MVIANRDNIPSNKHRKHPKKCSNRILNLHKDLERVKVILPILGAGERSFLAHLISNNDLTQECKRNIIFFLLCNNSIGGFFQKPQIVDIDSNEGK
jgi:hypothetical protein